MRKIPLLKPSVGLEEHQGLKKMVEEGWVAPVGPQLAAFESEIGQYYPDKSVLLLNSGTSALHLALVLLGIKQDDIVITSTLTFAACANVIMYQKATPVFLDSESQTWNLDPDLLEQYLSTSPKKPKAAIVTHLYGMPAQIQAIKTLLDAYDVPLIEDAAEALGSTYQGQPVGITGAYGILSFNGNKIVTTGGGGALILDPEKYEEGLHLATQANAGDHSYEYTEVGYNYRLSNVLASIGSVQLRKLTTFCLQKQEIYKQYAGKLGEYMVFLDAPKHSISNRWLTVGLLRDETLLDDLIAYLDARGIETRKIWKPLHLHPPYRCFEWYDRGIGMDLFKRGICLPSSSGMMPAEQEFVIENMLDFFEKK